MLHQNVIERSGFRNLTVDELEFVAGGFNAPDNFGGGSNHPWEEYTNSFFAINPQSLNFGAELLAWEANIVPQWVDDAIDWFKDRFDDPNDGRIPDPNGHQWWEPVEGQPGKWNLYDSNGDLEGQYKEVKQENATRILTFTTSSGGGVTVAGVGGANLSGNSSSSSVFFKPVGN